MAADADHHLTVLRALAASHVPTLGEALRDPAADPVGFLRFAHRHHLGAYVLWSLERLGLADALPGHALLAARASSLVERRRSERQVRELGRLADLFAAGGVEVLFLKGPLFAQRFYGSLEARGFSDLDVLVRSPGDLDRVEALLLEAGYERAFRVLGSRRLSRYFAHHFEYRRDGLPLDVHWTLQRHASFAFDAERIWATATRVGLAGRSYPATSDEYELVLQILGVVTDLQVGQLTLRQLVDIHRVLEALDGTLDWGGFLAARRRERILRPSLWVLALVIEALACRDRFPTLGALLEPELGALPPMRLGMRAVLASRKLDPAQKLLALRLYETPLPAAVAWWLVSLPFRLAVYDDEPRG